MMAGMRTMAMGARGDDVRDVQARLGGLGFRIEPEEHGEFGSGTERAVREFQQRRALLVDGKVGPETWEELVEAGYALGDRVLYLRYPFVRGDDVRALQGRLNLIGFDAGRPDGILGERTDHAIRDFQANVGLPVDGIVGATTLDALTRLRPVGPGPGRSTVREGEVLRRLTASIQGARIAIDAGHGEGDPGTTGSSGLTEAEAAWDLATAVRDELVRRQAVPTLVRSRGTNPSAIERAAAANDSGAELLVSIHLNGHPDPSAEGSSTYFFGREDYVSQAGQRLAELIQEELTAGLGLKDGRAHPKSLPLLRETQMPAVQVEPCFMTNPREEAMLRDEGFRSAVARALCDAVELFFGARSSSAGGSTAASSGSGSPSSGEPEEGAQSQAR